MVVSQNRGPQYRPPNTTILIMGTPKMVSLILGNPLFYLIFRLGLEGSRSGREGMASAASNPTEHTGISKCGKASFG